MHPITSSETNWINVSFLRRNLLLVAFPLAGFALSPIARAPTKRD